MGSVADLFRTFAEPVVAVVAFVGGGLKSAYNGFIHDKIIDRLRKAEQAHEKTMEMEGQLSDIDDTLNDLQTSNERQIDYLVAMGRAVNDEDTQFDVEALRSEHDRDGAAKFTQDGD